MLSSTLSMLCSVGFRPGTTQLVSNTVELLVHACSSEDQGIRLAASENLRKLIKVGVSYHRGPCSFDGHKQHSLDSTPRAR